MSLFILSYIAAYSKLPAVLHPLLGFSLLQLGKPKCDFCSVTPSVLVSTIRFCLFMCVAVPTALARAVRINNVPSEYWNRVAFKLKLSTAQYENMFEEKRWYFGKLQF